MSYSAQILEACDRLAFKPRGNQLSQIDSIVGAMLDEQIRHVILSAPTGTGKSIIGAVVAETVHQIKQPTMRANASFLLTATNALAQQYFDTFASSADPMDTTFRFIKGATNFQCGALSTDDEPQTAENCSIRVFQKAGMSDIITQFCDTCEFQRNKTLRDKSRHLITNYSYFFTDRLGAELLARRSVCVFDEAHLLNDLFTEHCAISFSDRTLTQASQEITESLKLGSTDIFKVFKKISQDLERELITDQNYLKILEILAGVYYEVYEAAHSEAERSISSPTRYLKISKLAKKYYGRANKIFGFLEHQYPHVFEFKKRDPKAGVNDNEVIVKPIFVSGMFETLVNADHNLLMSATISEQYAKRTLTLEPTDKVKYIRLEPQFDPQNKKVIFYKPLLLNYNSMKDPEVTTKLKQNVVDIVKKHSAADERGIVLAPSFVMVQQIADALRQKCAKQVKIFEHVRGQKLAEMIDMFKDDTSKSAILLTPSGFEGLDLPGDLSRYQIILKAPFAALGDKRIKTIADAYPDIYALLALMKIVQGAGRSVRGPDDHAVTYMLDQGIQRLWSGKSNEWKSEFTTVFTSSLDET